MLLWAPPSLHTARRFLRVARQLKCGWWWWRARKAACAHVVHIASRRWGAAARPRAGGRPAARQPAVQRRWSCWRRRRTRHVALHGHVSRRRHVPRAARALCISAAARSPRRRRESVRKRRRRRWAEPLRRRRHAERARSREALARGARVLLAHGARSRPAAARTSHIAPALTHYH